jgi:predicted nucleic acid-binding protein
MIVISNTTPLIALAVIRRFDLLRQLFDTIYIPEAVYQEAVVAGREQGGAKHELSSATWIEIRAVQGHQAVHALLSELDRGEAETIVLAQEMGADWVLMDEKKGRRQLAKLGLPKVGTVGLLLKAKQLGLVSRIRPDIEQLRRNGFSLSQNVVDASPPTCNSFPAPTRAG